MRRADSRSRWIVASSGFWNANGSVRPPPAAPAARRSLRSLLDERDLVDLPERGRPRKDRLQRRLPQERHALLARRLLDLRGRPPLEDHLPDPVRHVEQLRHRRPAPEPRPAALLASRRVVEHLFLLEIGT